MLYNLLEAEENPSGVIKTFKGINRRYKGGSGEFEDMKNMSSNGYPCLVPRAGREYLANDGIKNKRLVIPPINKNGNKEIPGFTGIAGKDFYYEGRRIEKGSNGVRGEFSQGFSATYSSQFSSAAYDITQYLDMSEIFPEAASTRFSYCYLNNRLFIFVSNDTGLKDIGYTNDYISFGTDSAGNYVSEYSGGSYGMYKDNLRGNVITFRDAAFAAVAEQIRGRNVDIEAENKDGTFIVSYYVTDVSVSGSTATVTLNAPVNTSPFGANSYAGQFYMYLHHDSGKYYYDAGKKRGELHNMEKGVCNVSMTITPNQIYTDETLGLSYEADRIDCRAMNGQTGVDFTAYFAVGDRIYISGCVDTNNNTVCHDSSYEQRDEGEIASCRVVGFYTQDGASGGIMYVQCFTEDGRLVHLTAEEYSSPRDGATPAAKSYCIRKYVPDMLSVTAHNQRLWGVAANGESFYASAVSDPFKWEMWEDAGASDPLFQTAATKDEYTGILDYGQYVLLLKPTSIQQVYSLASASTVSIAKALYNTGCIDIDSALVIANTAYYLGYNGFYRYSGGEPEIISEKLNTSYVSAKAFTDGVKYYASAKRADGVTEMVVFDTQYGLWHKEDDTDVLGGYLWYNRPVVVTTAGDTYIMNAGSDDVSAGKTSAVKWSAKSVRLYDDTMDNKAVNEIWVRAYIPKGAEVTVYTETNGTEEWVRHTTLQGFGRVKVYRVPVRAISCEEYRIRLDGIGACVIYELERVVHVNGRNYNASRERGR